LLVLARRPLEMIVVTMPSATRLRKLVTPAVVLVTCPVTASRILSATTATAPATSLANALNLRSVLAIPVAVRVTSRGNAPELPLPTLKV